MGGHVKIAKLGATLFVAIVAALGVLGCGDSTNQDEIDQARKEGAQQAREQADAAQTDRQIATLKKKLKKVGKGDSSPARPLAVDRVDTCRPLRLQLRIRSHGRAKYDLCLCPERSRGVFQLGWSHLAGRLQPRNGPDLHDELRPRLPHRLSRRQQRLVFIP